NPVKNIECLEAKRDPPALRKRHFLLNAQVFIEDSWSPQLGIGTGAISEPRIQHCLRSLLESGRVEPAIFERIELRSRNRCAPVVVRSDSDPVTARQR